jgi:hypothetical protein
LACLNSGGRAPNRNLDRSSPSRRDAPRVRDCAPPFRAASSLRVTDGSWSWQLRSAEQSKIELGAYLIYYREPDLRCHPPPHPCRPPPHVSDAFWKLREAALRSAPAGGRDGGVRSAAPDGPHAVREDVLRAAHHARRQLAPRRHLPRRARPTPVQGRECSSLSIAAPCYLDAPGLLARICVHLVSSRDLSPGPARACHALRYVFLTEKSCRRNPHNTKNILLR